MRFTRPTVLTACAALALAGAGTASAATKTPAKVAFAAHGSIKQAYVVGAVKGQQLTLLTRSGRVAGTGKADRFGAKIFRGLTPGAGYVVRAKRSGKTVRTKSFRVLSTKSAPPAAFYKGQALKQGLNYIKMRDGVELAVTVRLPAGKTLADGPFPTLIEYSGYQTAAPHDLLASVVASLTGSGGKADPLAPATSTVVGAVLGPLLDFAVVSVQMRGSGCSGGAFDLFDLPTTYDGYDAVETVAAQPWVKGGKVGMAGISFSGITQLFTAGTRPPHLAAIAPLSVTDDQYTGTAYPGGIFNSGFALSWIKDRMSDAEPAPAGGQPYAKELAGTGDKHCLDNQRLRLQTEDALKQADENPYRTPSVFEQRGAAHWMGKINVPTFLVGQFNDEQTGPHFANSLSKLAKNPNVWITMQNGVHSDSLGPNTITRMVEFLDLYVADRIPEIPSTILALSPQLYQYLADADSAPVLQSRFAGTTDLAAAKATFATDPRVRLLMDNGAGPQGPGSIGATWEMGFDAWPARQMTPTTYYPGAGGTLDAAKPAAATTATYTGDPKARPKQTLPGNGETDAWKAQPPYTWAPIAAGKGLGFTSPVLATDLVIAGTSSLDLYVKSSAKDTDLQVTLSEVRPDGNETYVQNGWLRASHRKLDAKASTVIDPVPTHLAKYAAPLPAGKYSLVRVPILAAAHAFRAGSRIRVTVQAPGGDRPRWDFATIEKGSTKDTIALGGATASKLVLPVVPGATAQGTPLPGPTALRGEPNRAYAPAANGG